MPSSKLGEDTVHRNHFFSVLRAYRNKDVAEGVVQAIKRLSKKIHRKLLIMHICGTHEYTITHYGIRSLLPGNVEVRAGPGCPVCVTPSFVIRHAIELSLRKDVIITSFGDMLRVPDNRGFSLKSARAEGGNVKVVYSISDSLRLAKENPNKCVVHLAIGFETTAPSTAATLLSDPPENFLVLCYHLLIPPAMEHLLKSGESKIDGFICPGHVSTIIGWRAYEEISLKYKVPQVVAGFEPLDVLIGIHMLLTMVAEGEYRVENEYTRAVRAEGNERAKELMREVFAERDAVWRGLGLIPQSGLKLRRGFREHDAFELFDLKLEDEDYSMPKGCRCGDVLKGLIYPEDCPLFGTSCTPTSPVGPCMVSLEGTCAIHYRLRRVKKLGEKR